MFSNETPAQQRTPLFFGSVNDMARLRQLPWSALEDFFASQPQSLTEFPVQRDNQRADRNARRHSIPPPECWTWVIAIPMGMQNAIPRSRCIKVTCPGFRFFKSALSSIRVSIAVRTREPLHTFGHGSQCYDNRAWDRVREM